MRKKLRYAFVVVMVLASLTACNKKEKKAPTVDITLPKEDESVKNTLDLNEDNLIVGENNSNENQNAEPGDTPKKEGEGATVTPRPVIERSTEMYVKLNDFGSTLTIRAGAGTDTEKIGFLVHAEKVNVIETSGDWSKFFYKDDYGYCMTKFLVSKKPEYLTPTPLPTQAATPTPTPTADAQTEEDLPPEI